MKIHELKIIDLYFNEIMLGNKTAELRYNDRNYQVGDLIYFKEIIIGDALVKNLAHKIQGHFMMLYITHITSDTTYMQPGYIMISFKVMYLYPKIGFLLKKTSTILEANTLNNINHREINKWLQSNDYETNYLK